MHKFNLNYCCYTPELYLKTGTYAYMRHAIEIEILEKIKLLIFLF